MATWHEIEAAAPALAAAARALLDAHRHKTLATLRRDGSPRISGIETQFQDGELWLGMMSGSLKARDVQRDPRLALHSASEDPPDDSSQWTGDAKLAGRAVEVTDPSVITQVAGPEHDDSHLFRVDIAELVVTRVGDPADHLVIEVWREGRGVRRIERR
jgi:hypothetical protein